MLKIGLFSAGIFFLLPLCIAGQLLPFQRDVNPKGWPVPDLRRSRVSSVSKIYLPEGIVRKENFTLGKSKPTTSYGKGMFCEFRTLRRFTFRGMTFAIDGDCVIFAVQSVTSGRTRLIEKSYMGAITRYTFYDEDGDGKFESRYNSSPGDSRFKIVVPRSLRER